RAFGIDPRFLKYVLESQLIQAVINMLKGGMGVPHLFQWDIKRLPIPLPSIDEQRRIADFLDAETARINRFGDANDRLLALLAERRTAAVIDEVSGGRHPHKRPSTLAWLTHVPESWD